ncbi:hypothetical protein [Nocardioides sp.]|uniref:hypothetical protein n=1 Tax=Nocardioides sp. TaxID=35761 RepID=UPI00271D8C77|nr:hypothetical protein [Nocardioides sp.]MDO9457665.1 hypothetical protein [Nocardioides sp.]
MPRPRLIGALLLTTVLGALAACGGGGDDEPSLGQGSSSTSEAPTSEPATSTPTPDAAEDEEALVALVSGYEKALARLLSTSGKKADFDQVATPAFADQVVSTWREGTFDAGFDIVGTFLFEELSAEVDGDAAVVEVCSDGQGVIPVKRGETLPPGATGSPRAVTTFTAVRQDGQWLFDSSKIGTTSC